MATKTKDEQLRDLQLEADYVAKESGIPVSVQSDGRGYVLWTGQGNKLRSFGRVSYNTLYTGLRITRRVLGSMRDAQP